VNLRLVAFFTLNLVFVCVVMVGYGIGGQQDPRLLHLILLFALCSSVIFSLDGLNARYALLSIFSGLYFVYFGVQDVTNLYDGVDDYGSTGVLSTSEEIILVGGAILVLSYRLAVNLGKSRSDAKVSYDWPLTSIVSVGILLWALGICATYHWYFQVVTDKSLEGTRGIAHLSPLFSTGLVLAQMLQPLGILLIAYAWRITRFKPMALLIMVIVGVQVLFGFVIDIKGMAITGGVLIIVTITFTEGRIPKAWIAGALVFIYVAFPVFQAYRAVIDGNVSRSDVLANLGATLDKVLSAKDRVNSGRERAQTFLERLSLKASVEMIVHGTERGVPFQHGFTLTPIFSAFLPRIFWTDKPDIPTGRIVNRAFNVTDQDETYISPSHIGELYWNFGWPGVIVGMATIGALLGTVARFNMSERRTVTRLLLLVVTLEMVIHGFEGSLASSYVVWLRCIAAIGFLHLVFARVPVGASRPDHARAATSMTGEAGPALPFPNLLR
jgi:hypothetical protein